MKTKSYKEFKKQLLKDKEVRQAYKDLIPEFDLIKMIIERRIENGLTQKELAKKIGTKQSAVSRFESGTYNPSFSFIQKIANALDARLEISLRQ